MADRRRRARSTVRWFLTIVIVAYAVADWGSDQDPKPAEPSDEPTTSELRITSISDADVTQGDAVAVAFEGASDPATVEARIAKRTAEILARDARSLVVRVPRDLPNGKASLRLVQGEHRSKAWDLHVRAANHRKLIGRLLGGLALFVHGLGLLALGMRGLAGQGVRALLGTLTRHPPRAVGVGVLVGAVTQLTSSSAALGASLVGARLLAVGPAIAIFVGAQLGASITGALLPVGFTHESLLLIAIGVLWSRLATSRRAAAISHLVLGAGLMLYGLHLLQTSIEPLVGDPKILPFVSYLRDAGIPAQLICAVTGALLAFVLQGPGPVYVLVIGLAHASGALPLTNALAVLAGTNLGAAAGMALIAWQAGRAARPLAAPHLLFGAAATVLGLAMLPAWRAVADALVGGDGAAVAYGHSVVQTTMAIRLAIGFAGSQIAIVAVWLAVLPAVIRRASQPLQVAHAPRVVTPDATAMATERELIDVLDRLRFAVDTALGTSCTGNRELATAAEEALATSRQALERQVAAIADVLGATPLERLSHGLVASLQLQRMVEQLVQVAELGVERGLKLTADEQTSLRAMHGLAHESFDALIDALERGVAPDVEAAGAREIQMNVLEAAGRTVAATSKRKNESVSLRLGLAELIDAYEHVGNHLFRVCKAMADDGDELG